MSTHRPNPDSSLGAGCVDPRGQYEFEVEIVQTSSGEHTGGAPTQFLLAHRRYQSVRELPAVGPTTPRLTAVVTQHIDTAVAQGDTTVVPTGAVITTVFKATAGAGYVPVGVTIDGQSLDQLPVGSGFWSVPARLRTLIDRQTDRSVTHEQVAYTSASNRTPRSDIQSSWSR